MLSGLVKEIEKLKKKIGKVVDKRIGEFKEFKENGDWFSELCFCILTANSSAESGIKVQKEMEKINGFETLKEKELSKKLRGLGYRFYNLRAKYIVEARKHRENLLWAKKEAENEFELREWLVDNVKGIGYKEASHFLRNVGYEEVAIIDRHILNVLIEYKIIKRPKKLDRKTYFEIEGILRKIAKECELTLAELDLYLWFMKTGKILK